MDRLDITKLKRDPLVIKDTFKIVENTTIVKDDIKVVFPARYIDTGLAHIENGVVSVLSVLAIINSSNMYAVAIAPIRMVLTPVDISEAVINDDKYIVLYFDKDTIFIPNNELTKNDSLLYMVFSEFFIKGNVPWYVNYEDLSNILAESEKYTGNKIGNDTIGIEVISSVMARKEDDLKTMYRHITMTPKDANIPPAFVGMNNIHNTFKSTSAKIIGGYLKEGILTAMMEKEKQPNTIATLLTS